MLGWESEDLITLPAKGPLPPEHSNLEVVLPQYHETLRPTHVVPEFNPNTLSTSLTTNNQPLTTNNILLIQELASKIDLDEPLESDSAKHWNASPQAKFERLLRETGVPIGLLFNRCQFRLVYAPRGETSGYATFNVNEMAQVAGRPMFAALHMLLGVERLFSLADKQRLPYILENSRKYQNTVSTALAEQVTSALFELLRGFQAANDGRGGELLRHVLANNPQHVYHGLLTVLMRLVFVLYAEDRGLVSSDPTYTNHYSISGLFERLRSEAGRFPDTMDQRFGAWAQLLTLFRLIYEGGQHGDLKIPARKGYLFDPDRYPFLEGRDNQPQSHRDTEISKNEPSVSPCLRGSIPRISDGVVYRVLEGLLVLDGERLSYRTLDVEQIGSVYEAIMGFELQVSVGKSIAIKPVKSQGAPATINLEALLAAKPADRAKLLNEWTDQKLGAGDAAALKDATSIDELVAALDKKIAKYVTPGIVPADSMVFQPSDERRRSGSHYTPRSLTQPIVRTTLEPILKQMCEGAGDSGSGSGLWNPTAADRKRYTQGEIAERIRISEKKVEYARLAREKGVPHPNQILDLKVCDPAMGSGAFLVETCRQLADHLVESWAAHADTLTPSPQSQIPPDEDEVLYARRTVAQRCLYGVDKNIMAVDLAKLSLWLVTLAKDHPFTFLDHSLRHGDSLVGLTREQIIGFHWEPKQQKKFGEDLIQKRLDRATEARAKILNAREDVAYRDQEQRMAVANEALNLIRLVGDACVSCFFAEEKNKDRENELQRVFASASSYISSLGTNNQQLATTVDFQSRAALQTAADRLKLGPHPIPCFHWEIEFPEVFSREYVGFDAFVGNPPFLGGGRISGAFGRTYLDFLLEKFPDSLGLADLVAYFFRQTFKCLNERGSMGLISTNTIQQGDTRLAALCKIREAGGRIYNAKKRLAWPGLAAVIVSVVHITKTDLKLSCFIDGRPTEEITAFLSHTGPDGDPKPLKALQGTASNGVTIAGLGFLFDDSSQESIPIHEMDRLCSLGPAIAHRIKPYLGGSDLNDSPMQKAPRWAIDVNDIEDPNDAPELRPLFEVLESKVKPSRVSGRLKGLAYWKYERPRTDFFARVGNRKQLLTIARVSQTGAFCFAPSNQIFNEKVVVFLFDEFAAFAVLQSRVHEVWARFFNTTMKDDMQYTLTQCFETFAFPINWASSAVLNSTGERLHTKRSSLMIDKAEGLTTIYNRFHSPDERDPGILEIRRLHGEMDEAVLREYGWDDLADLAAQPDFSQFLLDYEVDEDDTGADSSSTRQKKKPWRYRWPDDFRDEVLARLLELNEQRHKEELLLVKSKEIEGKPAKQPSKKPAKATPLLDGLDQVELDRDERLLLLIVDSFKLITRTAMDEAFVAMKSPKLRKSRLGLGDPPKSVPPTDAGRDALIDGLVDRGVLAKHPNDHQQVWKLGASAPSLAATAAERQALEETQAIFQKSIATNDNLASCKEGVTDAKPGLVSIA